VKKNDISKVHLVLKS